MKFLFNYLLKLFLDTILDLSQSPPFVNVSAGELSFRNNGIGIQNNNWFIILFIFIYYYYFIGFIFLFPLPRSYCLSSEIYVHCTNTVSISILLHFFIHFNYVLNYLTITVLSYSSRWYCRRHCWKLPNIISTCSCSMFLFHSIKYL